MSTEIAFPTINPGEPDAEGVVGTWFVDDGEQVAAGMVVAECQVDKISADVEAPVAGTLHHQVEENVGINQGGTIGRIDA